MEKKLDVLIEKLEEYGDKQTEVKDEILIKKVEELRCLLSSKTVDPKRSILGSEPFETNTIPDPYREAIILKIMELIKKF